MTVNEGILDVLDDLKLIHMRDGEDALGIAQKQGQQYKYNFNFNWKADKEIRNVVVAGMGGSGLAAKAFKNWPGINIPVEIIQSYDLPSYVNENTLLVVSSYSGNTEEELSILNQAIGNPSTEDNRPQIIVIASGGKLSEAAEELKLPKVALPTGFQPRYTFGYQLRALCEIFQSVCLIDNKLSELEAAADWLETELNQWEPLKPTNTNHAKQLALEALGKSVVIYASSLFFPVAYKWKISFNENAKSIAWCNQYSEFNHNEFLGWTSHPVEKPYCVIDLRSKLDNEQIQKRFIISDQLLSGKRPAAEVVELNGDSIIKQILWGIALGDFVSLYTAILNGLDPTPVDLIEEFKKRI